MHIPDGYLSPQTCIALGGAMIPIWSVAARKLKKSLKARQVPLLSIGAAFSFTIMMYNVPIPDGTTGHATGAALLGIILGPWAAVVGVSIALILQAFFFGDGGILALGANTFNMAFAMPFVAYYTYRLIAGSSEITSKRRWMAGVLAGFVSMNVAALLTGIELGIQPLLFHKPDGTPLYAPYPLSQAIPVMAFAHILVAGPLEGAVTGLVIRYLQKHNPSLLNLYPHQKKSINENFVDSNTGQVSTAVSYKKLWIGLGALIILAPIGLLAKGTAWGEWSTDELQSKLGYIPEGMAKYADQWKSLIPDYSLPGLDSNIFGSSFTYILSAILGLLMILGITLVISRLQKIRSE